MVHEANQVRIIGGKWRGRKLKVTPKMGIRPTTDMIRETLFNWLAPIIQDTTCLDLFAGSGALGFEALSRGAEQVVMVDKSPKVITTLKENAALLGADNIEFICATFSKHWTTTFKHKFDIAFLDPPFYKNLIIPAWDWLVHNDCFNEQAFVYIEAEGSLDVESISKQWELYRSKKTGRVGYYLFKRSN